MVKIQNNKNWICNYISIRNSLLYIQLLERYGNHRYQLWILGRVHPWMGDVIIETNNGMTYLFNESGDTIRVDQNAITGQSWIFISFQMEPASMLQLIASLKWPLHP